jgi:hypothetical protein
LLRLGSLTSVLGVRACSCSPCLAGYCQSGLACGNVSTQLASLNTTDVAVLSCCSGNRVTATANLLCGACQDGFSEVRPLSTLQCSA